MKLLKEERILCEMSQVGAVKGDKLDACIWVHPSPDRNGAYFKFYNALSVGKATHCARINFTSPTYETHKDEMGKPPWILRVWEIQELITFMEKTYSKKSNFTNWDYCKWIWNRDLCTQFGIVLDQDEYMDGVYNLSEMPINFLKSDLEMPNYLNLK